MKGMPAAITRTFVAAVLAAGLGACSDVTSSDVGRGPSAPRRLATGGSELLTSSQTLTPVGSTGVNAVTYSVTMPASGPIYLTFNGRIDWPNTAGNSNVLKIVVNDIVVSGTYKSSPASYSYSWGSEPYWAFRGASYGQPEYLWGLFWSPNFSQNTVSSDGYYVTSPSNPYYYEFNITGLVRYSQANNITIRNLGGWVKTLTGNQPNAVLQNITVRNY
ncbi:hypothetical protein [Longimicrobium sp.]|uniref:hypothetical protein n=1 Tax=Longimicrobium sp. TaxID=2029185 RepID=UPI002B68A6AE|nr:hypothetical protein [Longimicrobium sp.]HSU14966.1 hypothetical protein [Longimicrobium sp.]